MLFRSRHTTHLFYHELRNYAIDACTKKRPGFSERVCIDTFNSVRKERAACTGTVQIRKGLGFPNKHFATQNLHLCARMHCLHQLCVLLVRIQPLSVLVKHESYQEENHSNTHKPRDDFLLMKFPETKRSYK